MRSPDVVKSKDVIRKSVDSMDKDELSSTSINPGYSIRNGPVEEMDVDTPAVNGDTNGKRKSRASMTNGKSYKEDSSSDEDDKPLVRSTSALPPGSSADFTTE